jgi:hypothetical protein
MKTQFWNAVLLGGSFLVGVFAGRLSDVAQLKGFSKRLVEDIERQKLDARAAKPSSLRFYNNDTKREYWILSTDMLLYIAKWSAEYFVKSLPEIPQVLFPRLYRPQS